jgi:hypothetical protein
MVAIERKAPSSPVLCLLSSVVCPGIEYPVANGQLALELDIGNIGNNFTFSGA